jgi:hypothetical protein
MDDDRITTAPLFGVLPRAALRWLGLGLVLAILIAGMLVIVIWLGWVGTESSPGTAEQAAADRIHKEFGQQRFAKLERRQLLRCGLHDVDQQATRIWQDIDVFETEANQWHKKFEELLTSKTGQRLGNDPWVVRYFWDQWDKRLVDVSEADNYRVKLNTLILSVREALKSEDTAYKPSQTLLDRIDLLNTRVKESRTSYNRHRRLLDALVAMLEGDKPVDQMTLKDRVEQLDHEMILEESGHPAFTDRERPSDKSGAAATPSSLVTSPASSKGGLGGLYEESNRQLQGQDNYGRKTLIRDSVKDKGSSGR